jgi:hypothetical protein
MLAFLLAIGIWGASQAGVAPPGQFISNGPNPLFTQPPGKYRTTLGWLMASIVTYDNLGFFERPLFGMALPGLYQTAVTNELNLYNGLQGIAYYRYSEALVRDLARLQILTLGNDQLSLALSTVPAAVFADISAMALNAGIKNILPTKRQGFLALDSRYLKPGTEQNLIARYAFIDLEMRYRELMDHSYLEMVKRQVGQKVSAAELRDLFSESVISAAIAQTIAAVQTSPERMLDTLRRQKVLDVAAYRCACVLNVETHRPPQAIVAVLGPTDTYRTRLGYLLSVQLTPPGTTILNAMSGELARQFLSQELADLRKMRSAEPLRYASYMRSLLVDLEQLEDAQIKALQKGVLRSFVEGTVVNVLFGALAVGSGGTAQALSILANAGYGALETYDTMSDELKIRVQMASLREVVLDQMLPFADQCGCGAGIAVAPTKVIKGKQPGDN